MSRRLNSLVISTAMMVALSLTPGRAEAANILVNAGFESGALAPWFNSTDLCGGCTWGVTNSDAHTGTFSAFDVGNRLLQQNFAPVSTALINQVSLWLHVPVGAQLTAVYLAYSDASSEEVLFSDWGTAWTFFDVTSSLDAGKSLSGFGVYGCTGCGGTMFADDFVVDTGAAAIPEPASLLLLGSGIAATVSRRFSRRKK